MDAVERKAIRIELGIETALRCYLSMNAQQASDYYRKNIDRTIKDVINDLDRFGRTDELPTILVVESESTSGLSEKLTNLHGIGYRLTGSVVVDRNHDRVRYIQIVEMKPVSE